MEVGTRTKLAKGIGSRSSRSRRGFKERSWTGRNSLRDMLGDK